MNGIAAFRDISSIREQGDFTAVRLESSAGGEKRLVAFNTSLLQRNVALFAREGSAEENRAVREQLVAALRGEGASAEFLDTVEKWLGLTADDGAKRQTSPDKPLLLREVRQVLSSFEKVRSQTSEIRARRTHLENYVDQLSLKLTREEFPQALADGLKRHIALASPQELLRIEREFAADVLVPAPGCVDRIEVAWRAEQYEPMTKFLSSGILENLTRDMALTQMGVDIPRGMVVFFDGERIAAPADDDTRRYSPDERASIEGHLPAHAPEQLKNAVLFFACQTSFNALAHHMNAQKSPPLVNMQPMIDDERTEQTIRISTQGTEDHPVFRVEVDMQSHDFCGLQAYERGGEAVGADCENPNRLYRNSAVFLLDLDEVEKPRVQLERPPVTVLDFGRALDLPSAQRLNQERFQALIADPATPAAIRDKLASHGIVLTEAACASLLADDRYRRLMMDDDSVVGFNSPMLLQKFVMLVYDDAVKIHNANVLAAAQAPDDLAARGYSPDELAAFKAAVAFEFAQEKKVARKRPAPMDFAPSPDAARLARFPQFTTSAQAYAAGRAFCRTLDAFFVQLNAVIGLNRGVRLEGAAKETFARIVLDELLRDEPDAAKWPQGEDLLKRIAANPVVDVLIHRRCDATGNQDLYLNAFRQVPPDRRVALARALDLFSLPITEYAVQTLARHADDLVWLDAEGRLTRGAVWTVCMGEEPPADLPEPNALHPHAPIPPQVDVFTDQVMAFADRLDGAPEDAPARLQSALQFAALMPLTPEVREQVASGRVSRLTEKTVFPSVCNPSSGAESVEETLARDLHRVADPYPPRAQPRETRIALVFPDGTRADYSSRPARFADDRDRADFEAGRSSSVSRAIVADVDRLCGSVHPEQATTVGLLLTQSGLNLLRQASTLCGFGVDEHSPAEYEVRREPDGAVWVRVSNPPDCPLHFDWAVRVDTDGTPHLESLLLEPRSDQTFPDFVADPLTGRTPCEDAMADLIQNDPDLRQLDEAGFAYLRSRATLQLQAALASAPDTSAVDRRAVLEKALRDAARLYAQLVEVGLGPTEAEAEFMGWFPGSIDDARRAHALIADVRRTNPDALTSPEAFYREVCARADQRPDLNLSPLECARTAGRIFLARCAENRNLSRTITAENVDAFLTRRLDACAAAMGLDPVPAAADLRRSLASAVARRVATATQRITVPGAAFEVLLEKALRQQLFARLVLADSAEERQALVDATPGMPPAEDILVWNAIQSAEALGPELFVRLETAEGDELAAARTACLDAAKARVRTFQMLDCAKFRAVAKAEARVYELLGADRSANAALNLSDLRGMLSYVSVSDDAADRDAAAFDDLLAPTVDRFVARKQAQIASLRGLNLPQDAPLRALLLAQVMENDRIKFATAPVRVAEVAAAIGTPPLPKAATVDELLAFVRTVYEQMNGALVGEEARLDPSDVETFRNCVFEAFCVLHPEIEQTFGALPETVVERARERLDREIDEARDEDASHRAGAQLNVIAYMRDIADEARAARVEQARNLVDGRLQENQEEIEGRLESLLCAWPDAADGMRGALLEGVRMRCQRVIPVWAAGRSPDADAVRAMVDCEVNAFIAELAGTASARLGALTSAPAALALLGCFTDNFDRVLRYLAQVAQTKPDALTPDGLRADLGVRLGAPILDTDTLEVALDRLASDSAHMAVVARASVKGETMRAYLSQAFFRLPPAEVPKGNALDAVLDAAERRAGEILEELLAQRLAATFAHGELETLLRTATRRAVVETLLRQEERTRSESAEALMTSPVWQTRMRLAADDASQFAQLKADFHFATWREAHARADGPRVRETSPEAGTEPQEAGPGRTADLLVDLEEMERRAVDLLSEMPLDRASAASFMLEMVPVRRALEQMIATIDEAGEWDEVSAEDAEALRHEAARFVDLLDGKSAAVAALDGGHPLSYSAIEYAESIWHIAAVSVLLTKMEALGDDLVQEIALALEDDTKAFLAKAQGNPTAPCPKALVEERLKDPLDHLMDIVDDVFRRKGRIQMGRGDRQELSAQISAEWQRTLNRGSWTPIDKSFVTVVDRQPVVARSVITPARHLGEPLLSSYRVDRLGGVMCHCYDSRHAVNLAHSTFSVRTGDGEPQEVFAGLRHGVHSARGIANPAERKTANRMRANEVVQAARITRRDPNAPRGDVNADLHLTSISLLTPDVFRKGTGSNEREMLQEQVEAWKAVEEMSQGKTHVITFNFGVNAGAVGTFSSVAGGWGRSDDLNGPAMDQLEERCNAFFGAHPGSAREQSIRTLLRQLRDLLKVQGERQDAHDAYKAAARVAVITYLIGDTPCWNCKSGKDRTGEMDVECKFLATLVALNQPIPEPGAPLTEEQKTLFREIALEGGNHEMQVYNTGLAGFKTKGVDSIPERLGSDEAAALHTGASSFVAV